MHKRKIVELLVKLLAGNLSNFVKAPNVTEPDICLYPSSHMKSTTKICTINGCSNPVRCKTLCKYHYEKDRKIRRGILCAIEDCRRIAESAGFCPYHYQRHHRGYIGANGKAQKITCKYESCENEVIARKYCRKHYGRMYRHGEVVTDGYKRSGGKFPSRRCIYCSYRVLGGFVTCAEHKHLPDFCIICGFARYVEGAHIIPNAKGGPRVEWNMFPLCPNHHRLFDGQLLNQEELAKIDYCVKYAQDTFSSIAQNINTKAKD